MATKVEKLKPLKEDLIFIDPKTMQKICSFNECVGKFTILAKDRSMKEYKDKAPLFFYAHSHQCVECARKFISKKDKQQNYFNYLAAIAGKPFEEEKNDDNRTSE
jgi:hypothetical protein